MIRTSAGAVFFAVDYHTDGKLGKLLFLDIGPNSHAVSFGHMPGRVQYGIGKRAVVGHEEKPLRFPVEPAHRVKARRNIGYQFRYAFPSHIIVHGGDITARFVQHDVILSRRRDYLTAVYSHPVMTGAYLIPNMGHRTVYFDGAPFNQLFRSAAGSYPAIGQHFLQPDPLILMQSASLLFFLIFLESSPAGG